MDDLPRHYSQLCAVLDHLLVGVITISSEGRIVSVNKSAEILTGRAEKEISGKFCREVFSNDLCGGKCNCLKSARPGKKEHAVPNALQRCASGEEDVEVCTQRYKNHYITKLVSPLYAPDGSPAGCIVIFQDHSAFKDLIDRVRHEDRRLKIILDNLDIGILTVDRGGHITFFNSMAETITGYSRKEILGRSWSRILGKDSGGELSLLKDTIADGQSRSSEQGEIITREGRAVPVRTRHMALKREDGGIIGGLATISDLSLMYQLNSAIKERYTFYDMVGKDPSIQKIFDIVPIVGASDSTVLIEGPTGTGKDLLARIIHNLSKRADKPMVTVNCAALPDNLLESEMFGYVKGAFTGADRDKPGRFQEADGGTIFLDEIGELPMSLQAKLLQVLQTREFYPLGSRKSSRVNVRIIAATNQDMEKQINEKRFRQDLYYRLNVVCLKLPELKERRADLPLLIQHILNRISTAKGTRINKISEEAMEALLCYHYPGNVRELENILEYAVLICGGTTIELKHLPSSLVNYSSTEYDHPPAKPAEDDRESADEKERILATLKKHEWNKGQTAKSLNMDRSTLWRKMKKYNLF